MRWRWRSTTRPSACWRCSSPWPADLRLITSALKINNDLERMGDLAVNIAQRALALMDEPDGAADDRYSAHRRAGAVDGAQGPGRVRERAMPSWRTACWPPTTPSTACAPRFSTNWSASCRREPTHIPQALDLLAIVRNLERIADHSTNIAEDVLYLREGHRRAASRRGGGGGRKQGAARLAARGGSPLRAR